LHYTASVIITHIGGCLVHGLREDFWYEVELSTSINLFTRRPPIGVKIPEAV